MKFGIRRISNIGNVVELGAWYEGPFNQGTQAALRVLELESDESSGKFTVVPLSEGEALVTPWENRLSLSSVEGSLDVRWENNAEPTATPRFRLFFARYRSFRSGAQPSKFIVGTTALEEYLVDIGFTSADAKTWIVQLRDGAVSIPNVFMPEEEMAAYEQQPA